MKRKNLFIIAVLLFLVLTAGLFFFSNQNSEINLGAGSFQSTATGVANPSPSWNHTINTGDNLLVVGLSNKNGNTGFSCDYNGDAMTLINERTDGDVALAMLYLKNPDVGTNTVSCTGVGNVRGISVSYTGLPADFIIDGTAGCSAGGNACGTQNVTTAFQDALIVGVFGDSASMTAGANTNERNEQTEAFGSFIAVADMGTFPTTAGTYSVIEADANVSIGVAFGSPLLDPTKLRINNGSVRINSGTLRQN